MKHNPYREISAYLDGEADAPEEVEALLRDDPEARLRLEAYQVISDGLRAMPTPLTDAGFTDRVVAATQQRPSIVPFSRAPMLLSGMAALFLLGLGAWFLAPEKGYSPESLSAEAMGVAEDEGETWALAQWLEGEYDGWDVAVAVYPEGWSEVDPLAPWDTQQDEAFTEAPLEIDTLLEELAPDEEAALESLLLAYESGDLSL